MHIAKLIRARFPDRGNGIITLLVILSLAALGVGVGVLLLV